jgi:hypothetical protein
MSDTCRSCKHGERLRDEHHFGDSVIETFYCSYCGATWGVETLAERKRRERRDAQIRRAESDSRSTPAARGFSRISDGSPRSFAKSKVKPFSHVAEDPAVKRSGGEW